MAESKAFTQLVVVGSSAGGIDALSTLVATLPADFPTPIVLAQHLDPHRPSHLAEILARRSTLPVRTAAEHQALPLEPGVIYVVPANRHVEFNERELFLHADLSGRPKPSVDLVLTTAAETFGERLIAVILTGTGSDGAAGAHAVKRAGGTVIIQNPATAAYPDMPRSLAPITVDIVAELEQVGSLLTELVRGGEAPAPPDEARELAAFLDRMRERSGIDFTTYKQPTIRRRLQRRIVATGAANLAEYERYLETHPEEYQHLVSSFLIKVTEFFRDPELFAYLRTTVLPDLLTQAQRWGNELRLWSAGCATGEEAYSLAILLAEIVGDRLDDYTVRIFATDLDAEAVAFARRGLYSAAALNGLSDELIARYFTSEEGAFQVKKRVRSLVVFGQHDLGQRAPFPRIDLILCRNVLIYFTPELQQRTLQLFAYSLRQGGYLVLGKAESVGQFGEYFALQQTQHRVYRRQGDAILMPATRPSERTGPAPRRPTTVGQRPTELVPGPARHEPPSVPNLNESALLKLPIGAIVVDRRYDIQAINGAARRFLGIHGPARGEDLIHIARVAMSQRLREAIDQTFRAKTTSVLEECVVEDVTTGEPSYLQVTCYPQGAEWGPVETALIVISDVTPLVHARQVFERQLDGAQLELQRVREELAAELARGAATSERLVATNRELMEANQELTSANEELRTMNEELLLGLEEAQAATEEVETLNEEMQATNEELETLNEEMQATVEELNTTNDDLQARSLELQDLARTSEEERAQLTAILASMGDAVLVVNRSGQPLLTNAAYERLFGSVTPTGLVAYDDYGQPLPVESSPWQRVARGESFRTEFTLPSAEGTRRWYEANGQPVYDGERGVVGGVLVVRDITERKQTEQTLREQGTRLRLFLEQMPAILWSTDRALTVQFVAGSALASLGLAPEHQQGLALRVFFATDDPEVTPIPQHRQALRGESVRFEIDWRGRTLQAYLEPLRDGAGAITGTIGVAYDVTERNLHRLQEEFLTTVSHDLRTPLTAAQAALGMVVAAASARLQPPERDLLENARRNTERLNRLIEDLLTFSQLHADALRLDYQSFDLRGAIADAIATIHPLIQQKGQLLEAELSEPLVCTGDRRRLEQVVTNLLHNAHRHTPSGTRISIAARTSGNEVTVTVRDTGPGIPADQLEKIFERFHHLDGDQSSYGLGLATARGIVELHGGRLWVESTPGHGASFHLALPRGEEQSE